MGPNHSLGSEPQDHECLEAYKDVMVDGDPESEHVQDHLKDQGAKLIEMNLVKEGKRAQPVFISDSLSLEHKKALHEFLNKYQDVFAWNYAEMSRFNPQLVLHYHTIREGMSL